MESDDEASDAGVPGPGPPAADLSASDRRTTYDDDGNAHGNEMIQYTDLPLSGYITCGFCAGEGPEVCFISEAQFVEHVERRHPRHKAMWRCAVCRKSFERLHGCRCHLPKCKGRVEEAEGAERIKCQWCNEAFRTQRGVSQHERYRHPLARNQKRQDEGRNRPSNRASAWSKEEVDLLIKLDRRFHGEKYPNVRIREFLPQKTLRQISDKRRLLSARGRVEEAADDDSSSGSSVYISAAEEMEGEEEPHRRSIGWERWETALRESIMAGSLEDGHSLRRVERRIQDLANWRRISQVDVDLIVQEVTDALKGDAHEYPGTRTSGGKGRKVPPGRKRGGGKASQKKNEGKAI